MAVTQRLQDASGVIATDELGDILICVHAGPSNLADDLAGYAIGCIAINQADGVIQVNSDTSASATTAKWEVVTVSG